MQSTFLDAEGIHNLIEDEHQSLFVLQLPKNEARILFFVTLFF